MFNVRNFFSCSKLDTQTNPVLQKRLDDCPSHTIQYLPYQQRFGSVILGVYGSGKSTLLFQYAYSIVNSNPDATVMILLHRNASPPIPIFDEENSLVVENLKRIEVKYIDSYNLLLAFLANIHLLPDSSLPKFLFVDNLSIFFASSQQQNNSSFTLMEDEEEQPKGYSSLMEAMHIRVFSLLQNTCLFLSEKFPNDNVNFMISDVDEVYPFYSRWCPLVYTIQPYSITQEDDGDTHISSTPTNKSLFLLKAASVCEIDDPYKCKAVYELSEQSCTLKKLDYAIPKFYHTN
ncbi:hypothetical protein ABK040_010854 [Willaertia magna]